MQAKSWLAKGVSYIFHPLLLTLYVLLLLENFVPGFFKDIKPMEMKMLQAQTFFNTFLYTALVVVLLWKLEFAKDIYLRTQQERFVPLMAASIFYFWNFYVQHRNGYSPHLYNSFLLGTFITISLLFMLTMFIKLSMHAAAIMGVVTFLIYFQLQHGQLGWPIVGITAVIAIVVMISRYVLDAHTKPQLILGAIAGVVSQLACVLFYVKK
jgi:hypothetical protein